MQKRAALALVLAFIISGCGGSSPGSDTGAAGTAGSGGSVGGDSGGGAGGGSGSGSGGGSGSGSGGGSGGGSGSGNGGTPPRLSAEIRWTRFGIPHIKADDWESLGYGVGYAFANDNLCTLAEDFVTIDGERSKFFGPDGEHGVISAFWAGNRDSDFFFKFIITEAKTDEFINAASADARAGVLGYITGYNRYIRELRAGDHPGRHLLCANEPWLREITERDLYKRFIRLAILAGFSPFRGGIARAQPPGADALPASPVPLPSLDDLNDIPLGSNMYGIGPDGSSDGSTYIFGNPHFPWYGPERLHAFHITIPDVVDSMGVALHGSPVPLIGFNDRFGWSHTVSEAYRFTFYEYNLVPGIPTRYQFDGGTRDMEAVDLEIEVLQTDGSIATESRTLYRTHHGPVLIVADDVVDWSVAKAYAVRDANYENTRIIEQFLRWNQAADLDEFKRLHHEILAVPWVNTVASGPNQPTYYGDVTVVPNVPDSMIDSSQGGTCAAEPVHTVVRNLVPRVVTLNGSRSDCDWQNDADSPQPGIFGRANLPVLERRDWVHNCNDSYWLTNPAEPVTGFNSIIGDEGNLSRSLRTRMCIQQMFDRFAGSDGHSGTLWTESILQDVTLSSRILSAEQDVDRVLADICPNSPINNSAGNPVDISAACTALTNWDKRAEVDSRGALVWREFWDRVLEIAVADRYAVDYDSNDPINTPRDLETGSAAVQAAFADAVSAINTAGLAPDVRFGAVQYDVKNNERIEMFGGPGNGGEFTIAVQYIDRPWDKSDRTRPPLTGDGYPVTTYGNSWVYTARYPPSGRMQAFGYVTYSQSDDPGSPHYSDYTKAYSNKEWPRLPFFDDEIEADKIREMTLEE